MKVFKNNIVKESYECITHSSGLSIYLYNLDGFNSTYVQFATNLGSINTRFKNEEDEEFFEPPYGVAHFLEHKMFEDEEGDAFFRFSKTGANANAFTSFDKTSYLFSCTDKLYDSLKILLEFVSTPYFTENGVEKEKGIISEEINMYKDNADWVVFFNALECLYHNHPVKIDIAGTVESINNITKDTLYKCYNSFYNLNNMTLCVVGNFEKEKVLSVCDEVLKNTQKVNIVNDIINEPETVNIKRKEQHLPVSMPIFDIGFKEKPIKTDDIKSLIMLDIILECISGDTSELYKNLYDAALINSSFNYEIFHGQGYLSIIFGGESKNPDEVYKILLDHINLAKKNKISILDFENTKKAIYGSKIRSFESVSSICYSLVNSHFNKTNIYESLNILKEITLEEVNELLQNILNEENSIISIVKNG